MSQRFRIGLALALGLGLGTLAACKDVPSREEACLDCGTIVSIEEMSRKGEASGAGAVIGAVTGAVIGHQVGGGRGKDAATVGGAIAGGITGNELERRANATRWYRVTVDMTQGGTRVVDVAQLDGLAVGREVRVSGQHLELIQG